MQKFEANKNVFSDNTGVNYTSDQTDFRVNITESFNVQIWNFFTSNEAFDYYKTVAIAITIVLFLLPAIELLVFLLFTHGIGVIICLCYHFYHNLMRKNEEIDVDKLRSVIYWWYNIVARIMYDYEVIGIEKVPINQPTMLVGFHGLVPVDLIGILPTWYKLRHKRKTITVVIDKNHSKIGFIQLYLNVIKGKAWTRDELMEKLSENECILLTPGGSIEVYTSDEYYRLQWKDRKGFAQVAIDSKAIIVPYFTRNIQEAFRRPWYMEIFTMKKLRFSHIFSSLFNGLPVKLTTYYGNPIPYDENLTATELAKKVHDALQNLIDEKQRIPGNQFRAVMERFCTRKTSKRKLRRQDDSDDQIFNLKSENDFTTPLIESV